MNLENLEREEEHHHKFCVFNEQQSRKDTLIKLQKDYIKFLGQIVSSQAGYLQAHGINETQENIQKGIKMRKQIEILEKAIT